MPGTFRLCRDSHCMQTYEIMVQTPILSGKRNTDEISLRMKFSVIAAADIAFPQSIPTIGTSTGRKTMMSDQVDEGEED